MDEDEMTERKLANNKSHTWRQVLSSDARPADGATECEVSERNAFHWRWLQAYWLFRSTCSDPELSKLTPCR